MTPGFQSPDTGTVAPRSVHIDGKAPSAKWPETFIKLSVEIMTITVVFPVNFQNEK